MSIKKTLLLFIILVLMGAYYYTQVNLSEKQEAEEEAAKKLFTTNEDVIQEITLTRENEEIVLKKQEEIWKVMQPVEASADTDVVKRMVTDFLNAEQKKTIADDTSQDQEFGLDHPQLMVTARGENDRSLQLSIGSETPTTSGYYARVGEQPKVIAISSQVKTGLDKSLYDLRDKTILDFEPAQVKKAILTLPSEAPQIVQLEQKDDAWKIIVPKEYQADTAKMNALLSKITSSQIKAFITEKGEDLAQYGLAQPTATLSLVVGDDNSQKTLFLGEKNENGDGVYAKHEGMENVFLVDAAILEEFPKHVNELRDKTLLTFNNADIQKIELNYADQRLFLEKDGDEWKTTEPEPKSVPVYKINKLLYDLSELEFTQELTEPQADLSNYGLAEPEIRITLRDDSDNELFTLLVGKAVEGEEARYVKLDADATIYAIDPQFLQELPETSADLEE